MAKLLNEDKWISNIDSQMRDNELFTKERNEIFSMIRSSNISPKVGMIVKTEAGRYWRYGKHYWGNTLGLLNYWEVFW